MSILAHPRARHDAAHREGEITCPRCEHPLKQRTQLVVESIRAAAKRPITPEMLVVCAGCHHLLILSLRPAPGGGR